jgi:rubrerythrin
VKKLSSIQDVLDFAIAGESKAAELYTKMAAMVKNTWMSKALEHMAQEEIQHGKKLRAVKAGGGILGRDDVGDLGLAETLEDVQPHPHMDFRELLVFAIKKENVSHGLYTRLASIFSEPELQNTFLKLAEEEADHKRRFEMEDESLTF